MPLWIGVTFIREIAAYDHREGKDNPEMRLQFQDLFGPFKDECEADQQLEKLRTAFQSLNFSPGYNHQFFVFKGENVSQVRLERLSERRVFRIRTTDGKVFFRYSDVIWSKSQINTMTTGVLASGDTVQDHGYGWITVESVEEIPNFWTRLGPAKYNPPTIVYLAPENFYLAMLLLQQHVLPREIDRGDVPADLPNNWVGILTDREGRLKIQQCCEFDTHFRQMDRPLEY